MRDAVPVFTEVVRQHRRSFLVWSLALAGVSAMYLSFYPSLGGDALDDLVADLPEELVSVLGYDRIGTAGGWVTSTVYGLLGPTLLLVFAITVGARLIAGEEEAGTIELEASTPLSRARLLSERAAALTVLVVGLVSVVTVVCWVFITALNMDVAFNHLLAGSAGLLLFGLGFGLTAFGVGAATGNKSIAVGVATGLAVLAFILDALGPVVDVQLMSEISPFYWYLGQDPLIEGFDWFGLAKLATIPPLAVAGGLTMFRSRDLQL